jgi:hypothetical protein
VHAKVLVFADGQGHTLIVQYCITNWGNASNCTHILKFIINKDTFETSLFIMWYVG